MSDRANPFSVLKFDPLLHSYMWTRMESRNTCVIIRITIRLMMMIVLVTLKIIYKTDKKLYNILVRNSEKGKTIL